MFTLHSLLDGRGRGQGEGVGSLWFPFLDFPASLPLPTLLQKQLLRAVHRLGVEEGSWASEDHSGSALMDMFTHTHTPPSTHHPHPSHVILTPLHTLILALALALMGFLPQSSTYSLLVHTHRLPQHPPFCSFPKPGMSSVAAQPEWLVLSGRLAKPRHCLYLKSLPRLHSGRHIRQHLHALGDILRAGGLKGHKTVLCWVIHRLDSPAREEGLQPWRTAASSLSALDAALKASGIPYQAGGQSSKRRRLRLGPRWRLKGRGCSIKLSKDYPGISWAFKQLQNRTEGKACVLTSPTLTLWLTGVRTSSATTPDIKPSSVPVPLGPPLHSQRPLQPAWPPCMFPSELSSQWCPLCVF